MRQLRQARPVNELPKYCWSWCPDNGRVHFSLNLPAVPSMARCMAVCAEIGASSCLHGMAWQAWWHGAAAHARPPPRREEEAR